jgi:hypothetical protein
MSPAASRSRARNGLSKIASRVRKLFARRHPRHHPLPAGPEALTPAKDDTLQLDSSRRAR